MNTPPKGLAGMLEGGWLNADLFASILAMVEQDPTPEGLDLLEVYLLMLTGRGDIEQFVQVGDHILAQLKDEPSRALRWPTLLRWTNILRQPHTQQLMAAHILARNEPR